MPASDTARRPGEPIGVALVARLERHSRPVSRWTKVHLGTHGALAAQSSHGRHVHDCGERRQMRVLVIDDQPLLRDLLAEFLELLGHTSDLVADGPEALARFDPLVHQAVITDLLMPGMTGLEVAASIRT